MGRISDFFKKVFRIKNKNTHYYLCDGNNERALIVKEYSQNLIANNNSLHSGNNNRNRLHPLVIDKLVNSSSDIQRALKAKRTMEIIGPPKALKELDAGNLKFMESKNRKLGDLVNKKGRVKHKLRFKEANRLKAAGAASFQIASVITAQYYLNDINEQLALIQDSISRVLARLQSNTYGRIKGAESRLLELDFLINNCFINNTDIAIKFESINQDLTNTYYEIEKNLIDCQNKFPISNFTKISTKERARHIDSIINETMIDFVMLFNLIDIRAKYYVRYIDYNCIMYPQNLENLNTIAKDSINSMYITASQFADYVTKVQDICNIRNDKLKPTNIWKDFAKYVLLDNPMNYNLLDLFKTTERKAIKGFLSSDIDSMVNHNFMPIWQSDKKTKIILRENDENDIEGWIEEGTAG